MAQCFRERKKIFFKIKILCMRERVTLWVEETILWEKMWTTERERERRIFKPNFGICHLMLVSKVFEYHFWNDTISEFESQSSKKKKSFCLLFFFRYSRSADSGKTAKLWHQLFWPNRKSCFLTICDGPCYKAINNLCMLCYDLV